MPTIFSRMISTFCRLAPTAASRRPLDDPAPLLILHGDSDWLVPPQISEEYYDALVEAGYEDQTELYLLKGAGHGTPEFFQPQVREIVENFFVRYLGEGQA